MRELETPRLILRKFTEDDYEDLFKYVSDPKVTEYEPYKPMTEKETRDNLAWRCTTDEAGSPIWKDTYVYALLDCNYF